MPTQEEFAALQRRIDRLESIDEIRQLVSKYSVCLDHRNMDALVNLFAEDIQVSKAEKGRLALSRLQDLQRDASLNVTIHEVPMDPFAAVDSKLIQLAKMLNARVLTNDGNLCSIARLQGVTALNLNDLSKALRPAVAAGDEIMLTLTKEGREPHQAVGYLEDGTMIVVNNSRAQVGKNVRVAISSMRQTSAGRLFFAELAQ